MIPEESFKVVIAGEKHVGKTTLVHRLVHSQFPLKGLYSTILVDFNIKRVKVDEKEISLAVFDFGGEARFHEKFPKYARGSKGLILAFDPTRPETFEALEEWLDIYNKIEHNSVNIIISTKADLEKTFSEGKVNNFKQKYNFREYYKTSAVTGHNVDRLFINIAKMMLSNKISD